MGIGVDHATCPAGIAPTPRYTATKHLRPGGHACERARQAERPLLLVLPAPAHRRRDFRNDIATHQ